MGTIKTSGIIISETNLGDYDKMLTMLTPGIGKISCVAKAQEDQKVHYWQEHNFCALAIT